MTKNRILALSILIGLLVSMGSVSLSCDHDDISSQTAEEVIGVLVTILPQVEFVEAVGGERVDVSVMVPEAANPHTYELKPSQMKKVASAQMYVKVGSGVDFELVWMDKIIAQNSDMMVVDCSTGVVTSIEEWDHSVRDPHIWMSPANVQTMVQNICDGLIESDPESRRYYEANRDAYISRLVQLDGEIRAGLPEVKDRVYMAYHPAFGYFATEYDVTIYCIEAEGKEPTPAELVDLIDEAKESGVEVIFASPQFSTKSAETIADEVDAKVVLIDPLGEDYIDNMRRFLGQLVKAAS